MSDPDGLAQLVDDLAALYRALGAQYDGTELDRSSTMRPGLLWCDTHRAAHRRGEWTGPCVAGQDPRRVTAAAIAPALTPTAPNVSSRRRVPSSRPPLDLEMLVAQEGIDRAVRELRGDVRAALGLPDRPTATLRGLHALPKLVEALPAGHHLTRRVPAVLAALVGRARRTLDLDERWLALGECPEIHQDAVPVAWDVAGRPVAYAEVRDCVTYDVLASLDATRRRRAAWERAMVAVGVKAADIGDYAGPVDVWRRSHIRIDRDADLTVADVACPGCGRRWGPQERKGLSDLIEREMAAKLLAGTA